MREIELVIKISEEDYERLKVFKKAPFCSFPSRVYEAIAHGTPLPEHHGDLKDVGKIDEDRIDHDNPIIYLTVNGEYIEAVSLDYINSLPTIISATKEGAE